MEHRMARSFPEALPQLAKIAFLFLLFLLVPFVPPSLRAPYLYLLFNALVVALGVQAGFISVSGKRDEKKSPPPSWSYTPGAASSDMTMPRAAAVANGDRHRRLVSEGTIASLPAPTTKVEVKLVDRAAIKDVVGVAKKLKEKIKKCPSRASIFFIGSADADDGEVVDATVGQEEAVAVEEGKVWKDAGELMSKQELFTKAEAFIGNFYKQLKMQREESWNKLQDLYNYTTTTTRPKPSRVSVSATSLIVTDEAKL